MKAFEFTIIKTERLLLRQFIKSDLENVFKGLSDPEIIKYYGVSYQTLEDTKAQMKFFADLEKEETGIWWAICSLDNNIFYGAGGLNSLNKELKKGEKGAVTINGIYDKDVAIANIKESIEIYDAKYKK